MAPLPSKPSELKRVVSKGVPRPAQEAHCHVRFTSRSKRRRPPERRAHIVFGAETKDISDIDQEIKDRWGTNDESLSCVFYSSSVFRLLTERSARTSFFFHGRAAGPCLL